MNKIWSVENPETGQGKSSIAWLILGELARRRETVIGINADVVNPDNGDPVITNYVNNDVITGFSVIELSAATKKNFDGNVVIDGSRNPPGQIKELIARKSTGVIIPIRNGRGYDRGISYARELFKLSVPFCFVLNGFNGEQAEKFPGVLDAFDTKLFDLGNSLEGIHDMTRAGRLPFHNEKWSSIATAMQSLVDDLLSWSDSTSEKTAQLEVVNG